MALSDSPMGLDGPHYVLWHVILKPRALIIISCNPTDHYDDSSMKPPGLL